MVRNKYASGVQHEKLCYGILYRIKEKFLEKIGCFAISGRIRLLYLEVSRKESVGRKRVHLFS
jgi:hypothetical protein